MLVVIALGGNALLRRGEVPGVEQQQANAAVAAAAVAEVARRHRVVVTHGNGPQVGLLALQAGALEGSPAAPLDVLDAETEGMVGYLLEQELGRVLPEDRVAALLTRVVVDPADPAFAAPTKFIGPTYGEVEARRLAEARGWQIARDGETWRRVVASPEPIRIVELPTIRLLVEHGITTICAGGGGIPVAMGEGGLRGIEAVVDKDLASSLLATALGADALLLLTDVDAVLLDRGTPAERPLHRSTVAELRSLGLPAGSMGPKAEAVCRFVEQGGGLGAIGALADAAALLEGRAGTIVTGPGSST